MVCKAGLGGIKGMICPSRQNCGPFGFARAGADHACAAMFREFHGRHPHAATCAKDQCSFAGQQGGLVMQRVPRGDRGGVPAGAFFETQCRGQGHDCSGGHDNLFGKSATLGPRHDAVARSEIGDTAANLNHIARHFHAGNERRVGSKLVFSEGHQKVGKVETSSTDCNPDLAFLKRTTSAFLDTDCIRTG